VHLSLGYMKKTDTGFEIPVPNYSPSATQSFTWIANDLGPSVLALLKNYSDPTKAVLGNAFPVVAAILTWPELAKKFSAGM
jgi:hypothetical protein